MKILFIFLTLFHFSSHSIGFKNNFLAIVPLHVTVDEKGPVNKLNAKAFFINPDTLVTSFQTVANAKSIKNLSFQAPSGEKFPIDEIVSLDAIHDLAILRTKLYNSINYYSLDLSHPSNKIHVVEFQNGKSQKINGQLFLPNDTFLNLFTVTPLSKDLNGSPILFKDGSLAGVFSSGFQEMGQGVPVELIKQLLSKPPLYCSSGNCIKQEIEQVHKKAKKGDKHAQYRLGTIDKVWGIRNLEEAGLWMEKAAKKGFVLAQYILGERYFHGLSGLKKNKKQSLKWFQKAAENGYVKASYLLALFYSEGKEVKLDLKKTLKWHKEAAKKGYPKSQHNLGRMYELGIEVKQSYKKASYLYTKAAKQGFASSQHNLGLMYAKGLGVKQSHTKARHQYLQAAKQNIPESQYNLGLMYHQGLGAEQNYIEAARWYKLAAAKGIVESQYNLARIYQLGLGMEPDLKQAFSLHEQAAKQNFPKSQHQLGLMYEQGLGVEQNYKKAFDLYMQAAEKNIPESQFRLGFMYEQGSGVEQDFKQSMRWYEKAAEQGNINSQYRLGMVYQYGILDIKPDLNKAIEFYKQAASKNHKPAQKMLKKIHASGKSNSLFKKCKSIFKSN